MLGLFAVMAIVFINLNSIFNYLLLCLFLVVLLVGATRSNRSLELIFQDKGRWLVEQDGKMVPALLTGNSRMTAFVTILWFQDDSNKSFCVCLFRDSVNSDTLRRLRVRLKVEGIKHLTSDTLQL